MRIFTTLFSFLLVASIATAQKTISGKVIDSSGEALIGVNILEVGTSNGTVSDLEGNYRVNVSSDEAILEFTYTGYGTQRKETKGLEAIDIVLGEGLELEEVLVTALGISREKKSLSYAAQEISSAELTRVKDVNVVNSLTGKVPGVFINRSASGVGGSSKVVMRGNNSTRNNNPLYVVDGIPMFNFSPGQPTDVWGQSNGAASGGHDGGDAISNINPDDIESMSVLRGASAAALYGSQAANGAILVTTKKGTEGKTRIVFSSNLTIDNVIQVPEMQFSYGQTAPDALDSWGPAAASTDHVTGFFETGTTWINSISLSGGGKGAQSYFSYSNTDNKSVMPGSDLKRNNFSFRETANFFDNRMNIGASINFTNQSGNNRPSSGLYSNPLTGLYFFPRGLNFDTYKNEFETFSVDRNLNLQNWVADKDDQQNPYWILNRNKTRDQRNRVFSTMLVSFDLTDNLKIQARGNIDKSYDKYDLKSFAGTQATLADANGRYTLSKTEGTQYYGDLLLMYNTAVGDWNTNFVLGSSIRDERLETNFFDSFGAPDGGLNIANSFSTQNINQGSKSSFNRRQLQSVFGSASLGYKSMLYLDVTGRNDWSSTLAFTDNPSFFYPSVGLSAIISEMTEMSNIDFLKLRVSFAQVGNDVAPYATNPLRRLDPIEGVKNIEVGLLPGGDKLKPEITSSTEFGLDIRTLRNRLNLDFTYYITNTKNQFIEIAAPAGSGVQRYLVNAGEIQNNGIEALLEFVPVKNKDIKWSSSFNFTLNKNTVKSLHESLSDGTFDLTGAGVNNYALVIKEGNPFGDIQGNMFERDANGAIIVDGTSGAPKSSGLGIVGNSSPDFLLGWNNTFTYKGISLGILFDGRFGGEVMSITQAMTDELGVSKVTGDARDAGGVEMNFVNEDGSAYAGKMDAQTFYQAVGGRAGITEHYVYDATNIRLRELSIGYDFSSIAERADWFSGLKLSLVARNLFFLKNNAPFDPDLAMSTGTGLQGINVFSLPSTRSIGLNLNVAF